MYGNSFSNLGRTYTVCLEGKEGMEVCLYNSISWHTDLSMWLKTINAIQERFWSNTASDQSFKDTITESVEILWFPLCNLTHALEDVWQCEEDRAFCQGKIRVIWSLAHHLQDVIYSQTKFIHLWREGYYQMSRIWVKHQMQLEN